MYSCGLLTVSDSRFKERIEDVGGRVLREEICALHKFAVLRQHTVPDDMGAIQTVLQKWCDRDRLNLIVTTGGTGFSARDVTPEATEAIIDKSARSLSEMMLIKSMEKTKFAALSRGISGIRGSSLIVNLPGSPKAVKECISFLAPILPHAIDQLINRIDEVKQIHSNESLHNTFSKITSIVDNVADRERQSTYPLVTVQEAQRVVFSAATLLPVVTVDISESLYMITATPVVSRVNVPPFRASIKDGYAVRYSDRDGKREVTSVANAGDYITEVFISPGTCVRISTGAKVPQGSDAVVQVEDTELLIKDKETGLEKVITINKAPATIGQDIRPLGNDLKIGDIIINSGTIISAVEIGIMSMGGVSKVSCIRRPVIGVLSTGNELVSHTSCNIEDQIIDCNRPMLISFFKSHNFLVEDFGIVKDDPQILLDRLLFALKSCDVLVTTGGVSMGEKDYLKSVLCQDLNAEVHFGRIFMKPGKPMTFSTICNRYTNEENKLIFSLPGNPVSAFVTAYLFVLPALKKAAGYSKFESSTIVAKLQHDIKLDSRPEYLRCRIFRIVDSDGAFHYEVSAQEFGNQMSSRLISCVTADGLICLPPSSETCNSMNSGSLVTVLQF